MPTSARAEASRSRARARSIFSQGDPADALFYIQRGKVKVTTLSSQGKEAVVAILGAGDFFGEGCLAGQPLRIATVAAMVDSSIARLEKAAVIRVLHEQPAFSELFMAYLLARNIRIEADLVDQLFNSSEKRLARLLLLLANFGKEGQPAAGGRKDQSGNACRNDRHDALPGQLFHEQVPAVGLHRVQRAPGGAQLPAERRPARRLALGS